MLQLANIVTNARTFGHMLSHLTESSTIFYLSPPLIYIKELQHLETSLMASYELKALGELHWFLVIRVVRDRPNRTIWLSQESYVEQLASRFNVDASKKKYPSTPLPTIPILGPNQATKTNKQNIMAYQQRVGSLGYAATRC